MLGQTASPVLFLFLHRLFNDGEVRPIIKDIVDGLFLYWDDCLLWPRHLPLLPRRASCALPPFISSSDWICFLNQDLSQCSCNDSHIREELGSIRLRRADTWLSWLPCRPRQDLVPQGSPAWVDRSKAKFATWTFLAKDRSLIAEKGNILRERLLAQQRIHQIIKTACHMGQTSHQDKTSCCLLSYGCKVWVWRPPPTQKYLLPAS